MKTRSDELGAGINDVGIGRIRSNVSTLTAAYGKPVLTADDSLIVKALYGDGAVVLLRSVNVVGPAIVSNHVIELRGRLIVLRGPGLAAVSGYGCATIVAIDHALGIVGINPQAMMISVRRRQQVERAAGICGAKHSGIQHIDGVCCFGIGKDVGEIPGALSYPAIFVHAN